uniref:Uncharacterized protein n=1 Tax=viral metagenome TaxID=1070528 RepID=A0A6C0C1L3_9ZZZZ
MQSVSTRTAIAHAVHCYETQRIRNPQGRRRKLSVAYVLERIFYVGIIRWPHQARISQCDRMVVFCTRKTLAYVYKSRGFMSASEHPQVYLMFPPDNSLYYAARNAGTVPLMCWQSNGGNVLVVTQATDGQAESFVFATFSHSIHEGKLTGWRGLLGFHFVGPRASEIASEICLRCFGKERVSPDLSEISDYSLRWRFLENAEKAIVLCSTSEDYSESSSTIQENAICFQRCPLA